MKTENRGPFGPDAFDNYSTPKVTLPLTETESRLIGMAFTDTLLGVSLRGLDDTQVLGTKLVAELLKRGLVIVPVQKVAE